jgi:short-subunit dehydrogenase
MAERGTGGYPVNMAPAASWAPTAALPAYSATKAAVRMLTECLRVELAPAGIGVTAICPGLTSTGITKAARYAGTPGADVGAVRAAAVDGLARRGFPANKVAVAVTRAVLRNRLVVPVNTEAWITFALSRLSPAALRGLARRLQAVTPAAAARAARSGAGG